MDNTGLTNVYHSAARPRTYTSTSPLLLLQLHQKQQLLNIIDINNSTNHHLQHAKLRILLVVKKRYQAVGFPCNRMLKLSSSRGIRIDVPVLSVSWSFEDHSVIIKALRKGLIEHEASDTGGVPRWQSSCPDRLAEATLWSGKLPQEENK